MFLDSAYKIYIDCFYFRDMVVSRLLSGISESAITRDLRSWVIADAEIPLTSIETTMSLKAVNISILYNCYTICYWMKNVNIYMF